MQLKLNTEEQLILHKMETFHIKKLCISYCEHDSQYYRAVILNKDDETKCVEVNYVDYGNNDTNSYNK